MYGSYIYIYIHIHTYIYIYMYTYIHIYIYTYTYIHIYLFNALDISTRRRMACRPCVDLVYTYIVYI